MQISRVRWSAVCVSAFLGTLGVGRSALAAPKDTAAIRLADQAINGDYLAASPKAAETKLRKAIKLCGKDQCSARVLARVYRDLGVVQIAGMKKAQDGREAFARAVQADPEIRLEKDLTTPELTQAFAEMGGQSGFAPEKHDNEHKQLEEAEPDVAIEDPAPSKGKGKGKRAAPRKGDGREDGEEGIVLEEEPEPESEPAENTPARRVAAKNYLSLSLQQDLLVHSAGQACFGGKYSCFDSAGEYTGALYEGAGNEVSGGIGIATTRILLGYDRLLLNNVLAGARIGFAFGGGPTPSTGDGFLPIHLELRAQYHLFDEPFTRTGFRPYAGLGVGFGEVDSKVKVHFYETEQAYQAGQARSVDAWRKTGKSFIAPNLGSGYAFGAASSVFLEFRPMIMLGASAFAPAFALGYAHAI